MAERNDGDNRWELRKEFVCDVIRDDAPDIMGVQEAYRFQLDEFKNRLPQLWPTGNWKRRRIEG